MQKITDVIDAKIMRVLSSNARVTNNELAEQVGLSPSACLRRLRRLEDGDVIQGYAAKINPAAEGWTMMALASVRLSRQNDEEIQMFEEAVRNWREVRECYLVTGQTDYILKVASADLQDYERFIKNKIARLKCVSTIESLFIMNVIK